MVFFRWRQHRCASPTSGSLVGSFRRFIRYSGGNLRWNASDNEERACASCKIGSLQDVERPELQRHEDSARKFGIRSISAEPSRWFIGSNVVERGFGNIQPMFRRRRHVRAQNGSVDTVRSSPKRAWLDTFHSMSRKANVALQLKYATLEWSRDRL
jgi:DNA repair ATPase RecN